MKRKLVAPGIIALCMFILSACGNEETVTPVYIEDQLVAEQPIDRDVAPSAAKKKGDAEGLYGPVTGIIGGKNFTGTLTVTEFIEEAGAMYARVNLTDVKITGKDHRYLEFVLECETFLIPAAIDDMSEARVFQVAATCTVLNLNLNGLNTNVLGLLVQIDPINVAINANDDEVLGNLICTALETVNSIVDLVGILNQILGLLSL